MRLFRTMSVPLVSPVRIPPTLYLFVTQAIVMLVTLPEADPVPFVTMHVCQALVGWTCTLTAYGAPASTGVANVKGTVPLAETVSGLPPLLVRTNPVPWRPVTTPLIV